MYKSLLGAQQANALGAARAVELGAEGVGLLRTEFVFMNNARAPDLATQEAEYRRAAAYTHPTQATKRWG
nr:putative PEP-binding protein [Pseudomonas aeruginosa]